MRIFLKRSLFLLLLALLAFFVQSAPVDAASLTLTASPSSVLTGGASTISWSTSGVTADSCSITSSVTPPASVNDPTTWMDTGKTLPGLLGSAGLAVIGNYVYLFGGTNPNPVYAIWRASVSDPTTWMDTGKTFPVNGSPSQIAVIGSYIYLFGYYSNAIYRAPVSDPTTWSVVSGKTLPAAIGDSQLAVIGNYVYLFGSFVSGGGSSNAIYRAPVSDPTTWSVVSGKTLPSALFVSQLAVIGNYVYLFGGANTTSQTNTIFTASAAFFGSGMPTWKVYADSGSSSSGAVAQSTTYTLACTDSSNGLPVSTSQTITTTNMPTISVSFTSSYSANSCIGTPGTFTISRDGPPTWPAVPVTLSYSGSAVSGVDYSGTLPTSVTIPLNQASTIVSVPAIQKSSGNNPTLTASIVSSSNYNTGTASANMTINNVIALPTVESPPIGYTSPATFTTYAYPASASGSDYLSATPVAPNDNGAGHDPKGTGISSFTQPLLPSFNASNAPGELLWSGVSSLWYNGTPAPQTCYSTAQGQGVCMYIGNGTPSGVRTEALTVIAPYSLPSGSNGVDTVNYQTTTPCGAPVTHWAYVPTSVPTIKVPKYSQVTLNYLCQPNQDYLWGAYRNYGGSATADTVQQRIFRFANEAKVNGSAVSGLSGTTQPQTVSSTKTFTLECGGYMPEDGTAATIGVEPSWPAVEARDNFPAGTIDDFAWANWDNHHPFVQSADDLPTTVGLPPFYDLGNFRAGPNLNWVYTYWAWTWAYYNAVAPSFYQPPATVTVQACNANEQVVGGVCTPCAAGKYISGNSCVANPPPTATIDAGAGNGIATSVAVGRPVTVTAVYTPSPAVAATGGTITHSGAYTIHTFTSSGTFIPTVGGAVDMLVVGGGGGGGSNGGGGGGGGGVVYNSSYSVTAGTPITVTVGASGAASNNATPTRGGNSVFGTIIAIGGGGGASRDTGGAALSGGSGGGGGGGTTGPTGASGTAGQGSAGGNGYNSGCNSAGGGGGGAGAVGTNGASNVGGGGGAGNANSITGSAVYYGGGGGGGTTNYTGCGGGSSWQNGAGGAGGGGNGESTAGTANTGGGGGAEQAGGSGIVIVRYLTTTSSDPLVASAINDDSTGNTVDCTKVNGGEANCQTVPDATKTYSLPNGINTPGTYTFSAQAKTVAYTNYNGYATVQVKVCPVGQGPDGSGGCVNVDQCTDIAGFQTPSSIPTGCQTPTPAPPGACIPPGYTYDAANNKCTNVPSLPTLNANSFTATRVRPGNASTLSWNIPNMASGITCSISPIPATGANSSTGDITYLWDTVANPFIGTATTQHINAPTKYTLTCTNQTTSASKSVIVNIVPSFQEI